MLLNGQFYWWRVTSHGTAELVPDGPEVSALINDGAPNYFGSIEGAILPRWRTGYCVRTRNQ